MNLRNKIRNWLRSKLGISKLEQGFREFRDISSEQLATERLVVDFICEVIARPDTIEITDEGVVWKSRDWQKSKKTWYIASTGTNPIRSIALTYNREK